MHKLEGLEWMNRKGSTEEDLKLSELKKEVKAEYQHLGLFLMPYKDFLRQIPYPGGTLMSSPSGFLIKISSSGIPFRKAHLTSI